MAESDIQKVLPPGENFKPDIDLSKVEISDFILFNVMKNGGTESYLCPVDQVQCSDKLPANRNFSVVIKEYYTGNEGLFMLKDGKSKEEYDAWAEQNPHWAALTSIMWQIEKAPIFTPPAWWPYKSGAFHNFLLCPGPVFTTFMIKIIINMEMRTL